MESHNELQSDTAVNPTNDVKSFFGGKIRIPKKHIGVYQVVIPLIFVIVCAVVISVMINIQLENSNNIDGKFVLSSNPNAEYIDIDSNGEYVMQKDGEKSTGTWNLVGTKLAFKGDKATYEGGLVDRKYIFFYDENLLLGQVPKGTEFDAELISSDGTVYGFSSDGKVYSIIDGSNTEIGSYIADGLFIIISSEEENVTYLNCGDGITSVFYQAE
ncbi:MAG: hypothetical protein E7394_00160 [Ruminococcaceae bacterium]|nr:hypothetical protein [Oscillospiraceae bacterium]